MSVREAIIDRIPLSWEVVLRKHRCLHSFVNQVYNYSIPKRYRNRHHFRGSMMIIMGLIRNGTPSRCLNAKHSKEGLVFWEDIDLEIKELEESWK